MFSVTDPDSGSVRCWLPKLSHSTHLQTTEWLSAQLFTCRVTEAPLQPWWSIHFGHIPVIIFCFRPLAFCLLIPAYKYASVFVQFAKHTVLFQTATNGRQRWGKHPETKSPTSFSPVGLRRQTHLCALSEPGQKASVRTKRRRGLHCKWFQCRFHSPLCQSDGLALLLVPPAPPSKGFVSGAHGWLGGGRLWTVCVTLGSLSRLLKWTP